jgi:phosphopantothenoylcysteine decarboxylase/phosphopantothenate--cysteine ligase
MSRSKILFVLTGSIAGFKACAVVSQLVQQGHHVKTVATASALKFVGAATLEGLTGEPVLSDLFATGAALEHINLTRWADLVIICPATANTLNRLAAGLADDLVGALFLARDPLKPWLVAPAMNPAMWAHPATGAAVEKLRAWGLRFLALGDGRTACGESGEGRLAEPLEIVVEVEAALAKPARRLRVLITSGGTSEPIDGVRVIGNSSSGRTGANMAEHFVRCGHEVVLVRAANSAAGPHLAREETFRTFAELEAILTRLLGREEFDAVIHAAAVGDFRVEAVRVNGVIQPPGGKLDSGTTLQLELHPTPKLLAQLRGWSRYPELTVVAFKLTNGASAAEAQAAVERLFAEAGPDYVVHNDLARRGVPADDFPATIHGGTPRNVVPCPSRATLVCELGKLLSVSPSIH